MTWLKFPPEENKRAVWELHKQPGLDERLRELIEDFGKPEAIAIRRKDERPD